MRETNRITIKELFAWMIFEWSPPIAKLEVSIANFIIYDSDFHQLRDSSLFFRK